MLVGFKTEPDYLLASLSNLDAKLGQLTAYPGFIFIFHESDVNLLHIFFEHENPSLDAIQSSILPKHSFLILFVYFDRLSLSLSGYIPNSL